MARFFNYGSKNGISTIIFGVKLICRTYNKFLVPVRDYINTHPTLTTPQKTQIIDWLDLGMDVCYLLQSIVEVVYEPVA